MLFFTGNVHGFSPLQVLNVISEASSTTATVESQSISTGDHEHLASTKEDAVVIIEPSKTWVPLKIRDLWEHRELLYFLTWRDIKVRYKQTLLGAAWAILQPLLTMVIFTLLFGRLAGIPSDGLPYPAFAYSGLLIWVFFSNSVTNSGNSLVGNANLITKIYFPRLIVPAAAVAAGLVDLGLAFIIQIFLMIYYRLPITWGLMMVPVLIILITALACGVGMWLSALNVKYRDIRYAIPFVMQLWMFASPVIYPLTLLPPKWRWFLVLNPLTGIIQNFRAALLGNQALDWKSLGVSTIITVCILTYAAYSFRRMEKQFADIV
jgi:lipopolysaccharide transport system permease protein